MNNKIFILILSGFVILFSSCSKKDDFTGVIDVFDAPAFDQSNPNDVKRKQMYDTYGVIFKPTFDLDEYTWNWEGTVLQTEPDVTGPRYTPANQDYVIPVIDSVDSWIFKVFPIEFSKQYLPLNILLVDTFETKFVDFLSGNVVHRIQEGDIATNYILLSWVSERFDDVKDQRLLPESWLSLFVEKMLSRWPAPVDFAKISEAGYAKFSFSNAEDVMVNYALLKKGRKKQNSSSATAAWLRSSPQQDFGDFVAFIVYTPEDEKQLAYAKNEDILRKVNLVKSYFRDNFQVELPYLPIEN